MHRTPRHRSVLTRLVLATLAVAVGCGAFAGTSIAATSGPLVLAPPDGETQRLQFAPGTDRAEVSGTLADGSVQRYGLAAAAGQVLAVDASAADANVLVTIYDGAGLGLNSGVFRVSAVLPADGDYVVEVSSAGGPASYTITVAVIEDPPALWDTAPRLEFAPGTDNGTVTGDVATGEIDYYVLGAAAGQTMTIVVESAGETYLRVFSPVGNDVPAGPAGSYQLLFSGDHIIELSSVGGPATYSMTVRIGGPASAPAAPQIEFAPGTNNGSASGDLASGTADAYLLGATGGQTMVAHVSSTTGTVTVAIVAPDGSVLAAVQQRATVTLPATGDYRLTVASTDAGGPYQLSVWIA